MEKAYRTLTMADMTRPARHGSTREWKLKPRRTPVRTGGPKIPGMRKRKRKKRTFEKITCDDDVHAGGCWRYSCGGERWIISMNRSYDERMLGSETITIYDKIIRIILSFDWSDKYQSRKCSIENKLKWIEMNLFLDLFSSSRFRPFESKNNMNST